MSAITENGRNSQNVPFETELQLSDGNIILWIKIAQIPMYFTCKAVLSYKHNNDRNDERALIQEQIAEKMSRLCCTTLRPRALFNCLWTHTHLHVIFPIACKIGRAHV